MAQSSTRRTPVVKMVRELDPNHRSHLSKNAVAFAYLFNNGTSPRCSQRKQGPSTAAVNNITQNAKYVFNKRKPGAAALNSKKNNCEEEVFRIKKLSPVALLIKKVKNSNHNNMDIDEDDSEMDLEDDMSDESEELSSSAIGTTPSSQNVPGTPGEGQKKWEMPKPDFLHVCFFVINVFFILVGALLLTVGLTVGYDHEKFNELAKKVVANRLANVDFAGVLEGGIRGFVISGVITISLGLIGTVGVTTNNIQIINAYAGLICAAIGIQIVGIMYAFVKRQDIQSNVKANALKAMKEQYDGLRNSTSLFSQSLDAIQVYLECCGINDWRDFKGTPWYNRVNKVKTTPSYVTCAPTVPPVTSQPPVTINTTGGTTPGTGTVSQNTNTNTTTANPSSSGFPESSTTTPMSTTTCFIPATPETTPDYEYSDLSTRSFAGQTPNFPDTCCKTVLGGILSLTQGKLDLLDPECPYKKAAVSNPNTAAGCYDNVVTTLFNQLVLIASLVFTIIGVEVSAVSNAMSVVKQLRKKAEREAKAKALGALGGSPGLMLGQQPPGSGRSSADSDSDADSAAAPAAAGIPSAMYIIGPNGQPQLVIAQPGPAPLPSR